ncbi:hypothetical protein G7Y89_g13458 [Cudoniella acicularis]|uniref:Uncharacterized protein n=1 Tax=Cudoniella acicularis TaxID=354080 RepID=A0A8H4R778_9HELO|nr:hypothetical protein G7Y89_g13458 [Cudoniella acicularis]
MEDDPQKLSNAQVATDDQKSDTSYMAKATQATQAPLRDNVLAALFSWLTLAGPGLLHSLLGLITTLTNIYTAQGGHWSATAKIAVIMIELLLEIVMLKTSNYFDITCYLTDIYHQYVKISIDCSINLLDASKAKTLHLTISQRQDDGIADLANQLNQDIIHTTQFFEDFPTLKGPALTIQADVAKKALLDATDVISTLAMKLSNNAMAQVLKAGLLDNDFLLDISLQIQDFAQALPSNPFSETLGLYCSDAIPEINTLFQIIGNSVNSGITIVALPPNNCPS